MNSSNPSQRAPTAAQQAFPWIGETSALVYAGMAWSMAGVLVADLFTPLGFAVWVVYFIPVVLAVWSWRPELPLGVALLSSALMAIGYATDEPGMDRSVVLVNRSLGIFTNFVVAIVGFYFIRSKIAVRRQDWLQTGQMGLSEAMGGEKSLEEVGDSVLKFLAEYMHAQAGVFFVREASVLRRVAAYGVPAGDGVPLRVESGDGLLWRAVQDRRTISLTDVPVGYLRWSAGLAGGEPRHLLIVPVRVDRAVHGVLEFGF
ncbi:MAG: GAF domain-containing protein, partial [Pirellulaceae bacterium]